MKKLLSIIMILILMFFLISPVWAANEYSFDLQYIGSITKNIQKDAKVLLVGQNGPTYTKVKIKVDINGPATPVLLATDSLGTQIDIAQQGYWGPVTGFAIQGDFTNTTPIKATFPEEGTYTITLSLIDLANADAVITSKTFTINVFEDVPPVNNIVENNVIEELPKTGTSVVEYGMYTIAIVFIVSIMGIYLNRKVKA